MKTVKVELDINNDALTSIVNGRNAKRNSEYYYKGGYKWT